MTEAKKKAVIILYNHNLSYNRIADVLEVPRKKVIQVIESHFLPKRDTFEYSSKLDINQL